MSIPAPIRGAIVAPGVRSPRLVRFARPLAAIALVAGSLLAPATVAAHAELDTVTPADQSTVQGSPDVIIMTFVQNLDPAKSSIRLVDSTGKVILQGGAVPSDQPRRMDLRIPTPLAPGAYTIRWTTFSTEDGETARGTTTFTVAAGPSAAPSAATSAAPSASGAAPSAAPTVVPSAAPSSPPSTPVASTGDVVIPVVVALVVLAGFGAWLLRGRGRAR